MAVWGPSFFPKEGSVVLLTSLAGGHYRLQVTPIGPRTPSPLLGT